MFVLPTFRFPLGDVTMDSLPLTLAHCKLVSVLALEGPKKTKPY